MYIFTRNIFTSMCKIKDFATRSLVRGTDSSFKFFMLLVTVKQNGNNNRANKLVQVSEIILNEFRLNILII